MSGRGKWHRPPQSLDRLLANSIPIPHSGCWAWLGATNQFGYGRATINGRRMVAHKVSYTLARGPVPEGLELDHLCRVRCCINPDHLEPVTKLENVRRGVAGEWFADAQRAKTHCPHGHPYSGDNLFVRKSSQYRECKTCMRERASSPILTCESQTA